MGSPGRFLFLAALCACLAISCGSEPAGFNLVLIGVDTLRPDHLGCYGYHRATSPNIDRLAQRGVLFENAVSQSPWTLPSFATVFTSLYPTQHGAGFIGSARSHFGNSMRTSFPPLAMILLKAGYSTGAIINCPTLSPEYGVDRGFEYYGGTPNWDARPADLVTGDALSWIDDHLEGPFFVFVHYFDCHVPYAPPSPYDGIFDPDYKGRVGSGFDRDTYSYAKGALSQEQDPRSKADWNHIEALYDGEIAFTDSAVGRLLDGLSERGLNQNTLVVFISDHGEEFFDHKGFEHGHTLYEELIKVPLIFSLPGLIPEDFRVGRQVRLLDVMPTILDLMNIDPGTHVEGTTLEPLMTGGRTLEKSDETLLPPPFAYSESILYGTEKKSIKSYPWKLIYDTVTGEQMLFDLASDPREQVNLVEAQPQKHRLLEEALLKTLCGLSETWYVELAGDGDVVDVTLTLPSRPIAGQFELCRFFDADGHALDCDSLRFDHAETRTEHSMMLQGLRLRGRLVLALKIAPRTAAIGFDLKFNGESAAARTFLGRNLTEVGAMPLRQNDTDRDISQGEPRNRPKPPYALIWHTGTDFEADTPVDLADDTRKRLKALGYLH